MWTLGKILNVDMYFLLSLPRAGNTVLASVINQNNYVKMTARSILDYVIDEGIIQYSDKGQNFPDEKSYLNLIKECFHTIRIGKHLS